MSQEISVILAFPCSRRVHRKMFERNTEIIYETLIIPRLNSGSHRLNFSHTAQSQVTLRKTGNKKEEKTTQSLVSSLNLSLQSLPRFYVWELLQLHILFKKFVHLLCKFDSIRLTLHRQRSRTKLWKNFSRNKFRQGSKVAKTAEVNRGNWRICWYRGKRC